MNAPKVHNEWRQKMRAAKLEELKAEVKVMMENHEHAIDCRDSMIQVQTADNPITQWSLNAHNDLG